VFPIIVAIIIDCSIYRLLVGKTLYENDVEEKDQTQQITNPVLQSRIDVSPSQAVDTGSNINMKADLLTMECLDMQSSWQAIDACFHLIIIFVMLFWALLFFDMIADVYGVINGIITMTCFAILPAASLIALDKSNLIPSMISRTRLAYFFDRYLSNQIGIDMSQYKLSNKPGADHHPSSAIGSVSSASHHFDVEMMVTSQMHNNDRFVADEIGPALIIPPIEHEDR
jgi:hypothetical protein